jgi:hypothetical protein
MKAFSSNFGVCRVCKLPRKPGVSHAECSKIMQAGEGKKNERGADKRAYSGSFGRMMSKY